MKAAPLLLLALLGVAETAQLRRGLKVWVSPQGPQQSTKLAGGVERLPDLPLGQAPLVRRAGKGPAAKQFNRPAVPCQLLPATSTGTGGGRLCAGGHPRRALAADA